MASCLKYFVSIQTCVSVDFSQLFVADTPMIFFIIILFPGMEPTRHQFSYIYKSFPSVVSINCQITGRPSLCAHLQFFLTFKPTATMGDAKCTYLSNRLYTHSLTQSLTLSIYHSLSPTVTNTNCYHGGCKMYLPI